MVEVYPAPRTAVMGRGAAVATPPRDANTGLPVCNTNKKIRPTVSCKPLQRLAMHSLGLELAEVLFHEGPGLAQDWMCSKLDGTH